MITSLLELRQSLDFHERIYLFTVFVALTWFLWVVKVALSRRYRPWTEPWTCTSSVIIPVVDEPLDLFRDVLQRIVEQSPSEVLVVINGPRNPDLESVCADFAPLVEWTWTPVAGKRNAVRVGVEAVSGEVVLLVDSDTIWTDGTLSELLKPFADPSIGGVTTRQRILDPQRCFLTRWADWLEDSRALYAMPAQSVLGQVGCLPGRTIAFRRDVLEAAIPAFMTQKFLGIFLEVSDDRTLTNLTLKQGYRTVYQSTSLVYTDAPVRIRKLIKQQYRWARGSQYNTARMLPWMLRHAPVLALFFVIDIVLPFLWLCSAIGWLARSFTDQDDSIYTGLLHQSGRAHDLMAAVILIVVSSTLSMSWRQQRHLEEQPADLLWMPLFILFSTVVLMPIRMYGFARMGHAGSWGTRANAYRSGDEEQAWEINAGDARATVVADATSADDDPASALGPIRPSTLRWGPTPFSAPSPTYPTMSLRSPVILDDRPEAFAIPPELRPAPSGSWNVRILIPYVVALALIAGGSFYDAVPR